MVAAEAVNGRSLTRAGNCRQTLIERAQAIEAGLEAIVHIGAPKTGTSSLQRFLAQNGALLRKHGFRYPRAGRVHKQRKSMRHVGLALSMLPDDRRETGFDRILRLTTREEKAAFRQAFASNFAAEVAANRGHRFVISDEALYIMLSRPDEVAALARFLSGFFERVRIAVYLRSPDGCVESGYSQHLKMGGVGSLGDFARKPGGNLFFWTRLSMWRDAFGADSMLVREYDRERLHRSDVIADFCRECLGIEEEIALPPKETNASLTPLGQALLLRVNRHFAAAGTARPQFYRGYISRRFVGTGARLDEEQVAALAAALKDEIDGLSRDFFGGRPVFSRLEAGPRTAPADLPGEGEIAEAAIAMAAAALKRGKRSAKKKKKNRR